MVDLLWCLSNNDSDGRIVLTQQQHSNKLKYDDATLVSDGARVDEKIIVDSRASIRFVLLNASSQFRTVTAAARSVILLGIELCLVM